MLMYMFVQDVVEKKQATLAHVKRMSSTRDLMTKCHTCAAHMEGCAVLGPKLSSRDDGKLA